MSIYDPKFRYVPACGTDLRKTFARLKREQRARERQQPQPAQQPQRRANDGR